MGMLFLEDMPKMTDRRTFLKVAALVAPATFGYVSFDNLDPRSDDYLHIAAAKGLGVHEHRSKSNKYGLIDYVEVDYDTE